VLQFINKYNQVKDVRDDVLMWGDEIEYSIVSLDRANRVPRLKLNGAEVRSAPFTRIVIISSRRSTPFQTIHRQRGVRAVFLARFPSHPSLSALDWKCLLGRSNLNACPQPPLPFAFLKGRDALNAREASASPLAEGCAWMPEYGSWMIEGTPGKPYAGYSVMHARKKNFQHSISSPLSLLWIYHPMCVAPSL
jgi:hypothetical protein